MRKKILKFLKFTELSESKKQNLNKIAAEEIVNFY